MLVNFHFHFNRRQPAWDPNKFWRATFSSFQLCIKRPTLTSNVLFFIRLSNFHYGRILHGFIDVWSTEATFRTQIFVFSFLCGSVYYCQCAISIDASGLQIFCCILETDYSIERGNQEMHSPVFRIVQLTEDISPATAAPPSNTRSACDQDIVCLCLDVSGSMIVRKTFIYI